MAAVARGPMIIDASAVPFGCELEPVTGTGMCQTDITKTAAPISASMDMYAGFALRVWAIFLADSYEEQGYYIPCDAPLPC